MRISYSDLVAFTKSLLIKVGLKSSGADILTQCLCETSLRGVDSHGIRLLPHYVNFTKTGQINLHANMSHHRKYPVFSHIDGDGGFAQIAGFKAVDYAILTAKKYGIGSVTVSNSSHPGAMASYTLRAARKGYICFGFANADSLIVSPGAKRAYFGTNPLSVAAPRKDLAPFCLDMAPSMITWNKVKSYIEQGKKLPENLVVDKEGKNTIISENAVALRGVGEYKGYALASMIEVITSILTGMPFGINIKKMFDRDNVKPRKLAQTYIVMRNDICISSDEFLSSLKKMSEELYKEVDQEGENTIFLPGDKEIREEYERTLYGIPIDKYTESSLAALADEYKVDFFSLC